MTIRRSAPPRLLLALTAALWGACSDADVPDTRSDDGAQAAGDARYLIATTLYTTDQAETHLITSSSFDAQTRVDVTSGVKLLGEIIPNVYGGAIYVTDEAAPASIKRFEQRSGGSLSQTGELSFASKGVNAIASWFVYFVAEDKAYVFDQPGMRILVWNPKTMTLTGKSIDLSRAAHEGYLLRLSLEQFGPQRRGSRLLVPSAWVGQDGEYRHAMGLTVLDTERDELVHVAQDERCGEAYMSLRRDGDVYFFPGAQSSTEHFFAQERGASCALRVRADALDFDPDYALDLSAAGNGSAAASAVPDGGSGFYFGAADPEAFEAREENGGALWQLYHYDFASGRAEPVSDAPLWAGPLYWTQVGEHRYLPYWTETDEGSRTTLYKVGGELEEVFSFGASWSGFGQLR